MRSLSSESSALPLSVPPAVLHSGLTICPQCFMFSILAPFLKTVFSLPWKEKVHPTPPLSQRRATYIHRSPCPWSLIGSVLIQMKTLNSHHLIGPKVTVLTGQNGATLVSEDVYRNIAVQTQLVRESLFLLVEIYFRNSFMKACSDDRNAVQTDSLVQASP